MSIKRLILLGGAVAAARSYARKNPEKARGHLNKAADFADSRTNGKYSRQIVSIRDKVGDAATGGSRGVQVDPQPGTSTNV